jgi:hypothetical protein
MNKRTILLIALLLGVIALALSARSWLPPFLRILGANSDRIQALTSLVQLILWAGIAAGVITRFVRGHPPPPAQVLSKLRRSLHDTSSLPYHHAAVQTCRRDFRNALVLAFGEGSRDVKDYDHIAWRTSDRPEDSNEQEALYLMSWAAAEGLLNSAIETLRNRAA